MVVVAGLGQQSATAYVVPGHADGHHLEGIRGAHSKEGANAHKEKRGSDAKLVRWFSARRAELSWLNCGAPNQVVTTFLATRPISPQQYSFFFLHG